MPRLQSFMWKLHHRAIYHGDRLAKFALQLRACPRCAAGSESLEHAFYSCPAVRPFWERVQATMVDNQDTQITAAKVLALEFCPRAGIKPAPTSFRSCMRCGPSTAHARRQCLSRRRRLCPG